MGAASDLPCSSPQPYTQMQITSEILMHIVIGNGVLIELVIFVNLKTIFTIIILC